MGFGFYSPDFDRLQDRSNGMELVCIRNMTRSHNSQGIGIGFLRRTSIKNKNDESDMTWMVKTRVEEEELDDMLLLL